MATPSDLIIGIAFETVIIVFAGFALQRVYRAMSFVPHRVKLLPFNRGVILHGERVEKVVDPGYVWVRPGRTLLPVDIRLKPFQVPARDLVTQDGHAVRVLFGGEYKVIDPASYVIASSDAFGALFVALERVIPAAASEFEHEALLSAPSQLADRIRELIEPRAAQLGLGITSLEVSSIHALGWVMKPADR